MRMYELYTLYSKGCTHRQIRHRWVSTSFFTVQQHTSNMSSSSVPCCETLSFGALVEGKRTCYETNSCWRWEKILSSVTARHGQHARLPSGMHVHCNQHRSTHCVSRFQPLIWTVIRGSGFQLYMRAILSSLQQVLLPGLNQMASG